MRVSKTVVLERVRLYEVQMQLEDGSWEALKSALGRDQRDALRRMGSIGKSKITRPLRIIEVREN